MKTKKPNNTQENKGQAFLKEYMEMTGMSVAQVSEKTGLTRQFIYYVLDGKHRIGIDSARKIHDALGVKYDRII